MLKTSLKKEYFENIHANCHKGWGFSFRRSQLFRYESYQKSLNKSYSYNKILDIGCSTGYFTKYHLSSLSQNQVYACDISEKAINSAKVSYPEISFSVQHLPNLEYPSNTFDCI